jgi:hypothetical protein
MHKDSSIEKQTFCRIMRGNGTHYQSPLFYCISHRLRRGNVVARVYNLQAEVTMFLEEENLVHPEHFHNKYFVSKLAYLSDILRSSVH